MEILVTDPDFLMPFSQFLMDIFEVFLSTLKSIKNIFIYTVEIGIGRVKSSCDTFINISEVFIGFLKSSLDVIIDS